MVLDRSKAKGLSAVRNLNVWGCGLTDISILGNLPNLEVLNLSCNNIRSLKDLKSCHKLTELYLRRNQIDSFDELEHLTQLQHLKILWLNDNPLSNESQYKEKVSKILPRVSKLDNMALCSIKSGGKEHIVQAIVLLLGDLGKEELSAVRKKIDDLLQ